MNRVAVCSGGMILLLLVSGCKSSIFSPNLGSHFRLPSWAGGSHPIPTPPDQLDRPEAVADGESTVGDSSRFLAAGDLPAPEAAKLARILSTANLAFQDGSLPEAAESYRKIIQLQPKHAVAHHRLGIIADRQHDFDAADKHYELASLNDPGNADLLSDYGWSKLLRNDLDASEALLNRAIELDPKHPHARNNLGVLKGRRQDYDGALEAFRLAGSEAEAQDKIAEIFPRGRPELEDSKRTLPRNRVLPEIPAVRGLPATTLPAVIGAAGEQPAAVPRRTQPLGISPLPRSRAVPELPGRPLRLFPPPGAAPALGDPVGAGRAIPASATPAAGAGLDPDFSRSAALLGLSIGPGQLGRATTVGPPAGSGIPSPPAFGSPPPAITPAITPGLDPLKKFENELEFGAIDERRRLRRTLQSPTTNPAP